MIKIAKFILGSDHPMITSPLTMDEFTNILPAGLFTTFVTIADRTKVIGLNSHIKRLSASIGFTTLRNYLRIFLTKIDTNEELKIRIINNGGDGLDSIIFLAEAFVPINPNLLKNGVTVGLSNIIRDAPKIKSTSYISKSYDARLENQSSGIYESLIVKNHKITEGFTSNVYFFCENKLVTASQDILSGVTRKRVLTIVRELGIPIRYRSFRVADLLQVQEAFITSSSRGVLPIKQIGDYQLPSLGRGEVTKLIQDRYFETIYEIADVI